MRGVSYPASIHHLSGESVGHGRDWVLYGVHDGVYDDLSFRRHLLGRRPVFTLLFVGGNFYALDWVTNHNHSRRQVG